MCSAREHDWVSFSSGMQPAFVIPLHLLRCGQSSLIFFIVMVRFSTAFPSSAGNTSLSLILRKYAALSYCGPGVKTAQGVVAIAMRFFLVAIRAHSSVIRGHMMLSSVRE